MQSKNTVYTITPPDTRLSSTGPSILLLGITFDDVEPFVKIFDKLLPVIELTFYASDEGMTNDNVAWYRSAAGLSSSVFIDIDNATTEEVFLAMQAETEESKTVFWITQQHKNPNLQKLLNSFQYQVFDGTQELERFLEAEFVKTS